MKQTQTGPQIIVMPDERRYAADIEARVAEIWDAESSRKPTLHDGRLLSVVSLTEDMIRVVPCRYRYFVAQLADKDLFGALEVRPLAVSGMLFCDRQVVFGLRSVDSSQDPGRIELLPSGSVELPDDRPQVDPAVDLMRELHEEAGVPAEAVSSVRHLGVIEDEHTHVVDVSMAIELSIGLNELMNAVSRRGNREYSEIFSAPVSGLDAALEGWGDRVAETSRCLVDLWKNQHRDDLTPRQRSA